MATSEIKANKGAVVHEINGVKYFKLQSPYAGDYTKNCGLLGNEIDENFFFLRSNDIESIAVNDEGKLTLKRVDGSELSVNTKEFGVYSFDFDKVKGELTITYPDGTQDVLGGFLISGYVHVASNETLKGDGSVVNPLGISEVEVTGTYAPAHKLLDMTKYDYFHKVEVDEEEEERKHGKHDHHRGPKYTYQPINVEDIPEGEKVLTLSVIPCVVKENSPEYIRVWHMVCLPDKNVGKGYRVVTKEFVDTFGLLYNFEGVKKIKEALEETGSQWRIPSREDWADLLNAAEYCDENRNHDTECVNEWTGKDAGARAKSRHFWKKSNDEEYGLPVNGEDNLPETGGNQTFRIFPVGYGEGSRGAHDFDHDVEALHKLASYWTSTEVGCGSGQSNVYTRTFAYDTRKVLQESSKPSSRLSLRLVRDYDYKNMGVREVETILGYDVPVTLITNEDTDYTKVWTVVNVNFSEPQYGGVTSFQWNDDEFPEYYKKEVYYINEFDGEKWIKKSMREGDSVVLIDGGLNEDGEMIYNHEWRIYREGNKLYLVDTIDALRNELKKDIEQFQNQIDDLNQRVDDLDEKVTKEVERLDQKIDDEAERAKEAEEKLQENIDGLHLVQVVVDDDKYVASYELHNVNNENQENSVTINIPRDERIKEITYGYDDDAENPVSIDETNGEWIVRPSETGENEFIFVVYYSYDAEKDKYVYKLVKIPIEDFLNENEFKDGLEVVDHNVKVKIDDESDKDYNEEYFLTVGENGVKLSGVKKVFDGLKDAVGIDDDELDKGKIDFNKPTYEEVSVEELNPSEIRSAVPMEDVPSDDSLSEKYVNGENIPEYIVVDVTNDEGETEPHYYKLASKTNYISEETNAVSAIIKLDESLKNEENARIEEDEKLAAEIERVEDKVDEEIERAKAAEKQLQDNIDEEAEKREDMDNYLNGQDIKDEEYVLGINGLDLKRKIGTEIIHIDFDADFGEI